jgi:hypothetical protein
MPSSSALSPFATPSKESAERVATSVAACNEGLHHGKSGSVACERARLHEALSRSIAQAKAGNLVDADEVIGKLLARG